MTRGSRAARLAIVGLTIMCLAPPPVMAWEADVHFCLTLWLALKAGFTPSHADLIASGDLSYDTGTYRPATITYAIQVLLLGDVGAARDIQRYHFPSDGDVPGPPSKRPVVRGSDAAQEELAPWMRTHRGEPARVLRRLGEAIHPLQDSWSHQGVPDVPFRPCLQFRPELSWSHPEARGGWVRHDADLAHVNPQDALDAAARTYEVMRKFLTLNGALATTQTPPDWSTLRPIVERFLRADCKEAKADWLRAELRDPAMRDRALRLVAGFNVPGSVANLPPPPRAVPGPARPGGRALAPLVPLPLLETVQELLTTWVVQRDVSRALSFVDLDQIARLLSACGIDKARVADWVRRYLTMWLIADHGLVNRLGHGDLASGSWQDLPSEPPRTGELASAQYETVEDALLGSALGATHTVLPLSAEQAPGLQDPHGVVFRFRAQPRDSLILVMARIQGAWRVVRMWWVTA